MKSLISVIVPIYNRETYLHRCIDSILAQTYQDLEVLLVDDGSTDTSGQICDEYEKKDHRIKVFHIPNGGVSNARNVGLDNAQGEYILFVDSDDWIDENHIQLLFPTQESDVICCNCIVETPLSKEKHCSDELQYDISDFQRDFEKGYIKYSILHPWHILYKKEIIEKNNIRFIDDISYGEDEIFNMYYLYYCKTISKLDNYTYHYWQMKNGESLCGKYHSNMLQCIKEKMKAWEFFSKRELWATRLVQWRWVINYYQLQMNSKKARKIKKDAKKQLQTTYKDLFFRECISYMKQHGTLDEKIESYFMGYHRHALFKPTYALVVFFYRIKNIFKPKNKCESDKA